MAFGYVYTKIIRAHSGPAADDDRAPASEHRHEADQTNVYNHNFMTLDGQPPGPDYGYPSRSSCSGHNAARGPDHLPSADGPRRLGAPPATRRTSAGRAGGLNPPNGSRCGQAQMQALAEPQGNRLVYKKVARGRGVLPERIHRLRLRPWPITRSGSRTGRSARACAYRRPADVALRLLVDPDRAWRRRALRRYRGRTRSGIHLEVDLRLLRFEVTVRRESCGSLLRLL